MAKKVNRDYLLRLVSLLIAVGLWFYVVYAENPQQETWIKNIPVTYKGEELLSGNSLVIVGGKISGTAVKVSGRRKNIVLLKQNSISAVVDLSGITKAGTYRVAIDVSFPIDGISITDKKPYNLDIVVEPLVTRAIPVRVETAGNPAEEFAIDTVKATPETVLIKGAKSEVDKISSAVARIDTKGIEETVKNMCSVLLVKGDGSEYKGGAITVLDGNVEVEISIAKSKTVPITPDVVSPDGEIESVVLDMETVEIKASGAQADAVDEILTSQVSVPYSETPVSVSLPLLLPEGISSDITEVLATVIFKTGDIKTPGGADAQDTAN